MIGLMLTLTFLFSMISVAFADGGYHHSRGLTREKNERMLKLMKKLLAVLAAVLLLLCSSCLSAAEEEQKTTGIRSAKEISWAGADMILLDDVLIRADTGTELMDRVSYIVPAGRYAVVVTADNEWFRLDQNGNLKKVELPAGEYDGADGSCGLIYSRFTDGSSENDEIFMYDAELDKVTIHELGRYGEVEIYHDPEGNAYYVITDPFSIYQADGSPVYQEKDSSAYPVPNAQLKYQTNGYLTVQGNQAKIISAYTGEKIAAFDMEWAPYEANEYQIYENNTGVIGKGASRGAGNVLIGLDGTVLKELPDEFQFRPMWGNLTAMISFESYDSGGVYDFVADRTYCIKDGSDTWECQETGLHYTYVSEEYDSPLRCEETGEEFSGFEKIGTPIPMREKIYAPTARRYYHYIQVPDEDRMEIESPDGTIVGNSNWESFPWDGWLIYDLQCRYVARGYKNVWAVKDQDGLQGVISMSGDTVLPIEYDQVNYIRTFGDTAYQEGFCLTALKDQTWYVFDEQGREFFPEETPSPTPESKADVPSFSSRFPGKEVQLAKLGGNERVTLFSGPGTYYTVIRKINPREKNTTTAYFIENDLVYVHYVHRSVDAYAYVVKEALTADSLKDVPETDELPYVLQRTSKVLMPKTGPGEGFEKWPGKDIPKDTSIKCFFTENNHCFIEFGSQTGAARAWVAVDSDKNLQGLTSNAEK